MPIGSRIFIAVLIGALGGIVNSAGVGDGSLSAPQAQTFTLTQTRLRDPFILPDVESGTYYLLTSIMHPPGSNRHGVSVLTSKDLQTWQGPYPIFEIEPDFWAQGSVWAPEMHRYQGRYYLFATMNGREKLPDEPWPDWPDKTKRGTQVLVAETPLGPFKPFRNRAQTDPNLMTLDGTLWVEDGVPYMVYCHEWVQIKDGTIDLIHLKNDLSDVEGGPITLLRASDAPWTPPDKDHYVTDGPCLYRTETDTLMMIWSSFTATGYTTGIAISQSGRVHGPWRHQREPLFTADGGHGCIFRTFEGTLMLTLHSPNRSGRERALLFELEDTGATIRIKKKW
ncbi:MAG: family 43 glycosylhydrolase [Phycisphaerales bacterium]|nr:MAG: family 43 glycosylhydrolase [Phycisphaerales bacterium]